MSRTIPDRRPETVTRKTPTRRQRLACLFGAHDWTARVDLGADAKDFLGDGAHPLTAFFEFAAPVCRHCPIQLPPRTP